MIVESETVTVEWTLVNEHHTGRTFSEETEARFWAERSDLPLRKETTVVTVELA